MDEQSKKEIQDLIDDRIRFAARFSQRKIGDTPTDDNQYTPRGYVNMFGSVAGRPSSIMAQVGQQYFSTTTNYPIFFTSNNNWVSATGSVVASN